MVGKSNSEPVTAGADLPGDLIISHVKLYRKSHDQIGRYHMGLGEKTASLYKMDLIEHILVVFTSDFACDQLITLLVYSHALTYICILE